MANNRPINRRPWRKKPWARSKVRPKRWNAVINGFDSEDPRIEPILIPMGPAPTLPIATLVSGQVDVEPWADDQEVTLDRIVGSISLRATSFWDSNVVIVPPNCFVQLGLLVNEEVTKDASGQTIDIFEQESLEDYEWMWLWGGYVEFDSTRFLSGTQYVTDANTRIEVDIRNRRKIGQSDELNLYAQYLMDTSSTGAGIPVLQATWSLRTVLMSR